MLTGAALGSKMNTQTRKQLRVLLIENNKSDQRAFRQLLEQKNLPYVSTIVAGIAEARNVLDLKRFDVIISDYYFDDGTLFDILSSIVDIPVIVATGVGNQDVAVKAMKAGAYDYLVKDVERNYLEVLPLLVENAFKHKQAEDKYRMLSHAAKCIKDSVYITDMNDNIIFVNKAFCQTYGYEEDEILGKLSAVLWREASADDDVKKVLPLIDESGWRKELYHQRKDGSEFPISLSRSLITDDAGNEVAVVGVVHDITERKRVEETLQKAKEAAEDAARTKSEFLANMSHEIRTPLNAIIGMTDLLLETNLNADQLEYLNVVQPSSEALLGVINDLLEFSKIEVGQLELEATDFNLRNLVEQVADMFSIRAESKGLELMCHIEPNVPNWLVGDPNHLRQILINLVSNATKFTEEGEVTIKVEASKRRSLDSDESHTYDVHFVISDTGIGISKDKQSLIFEKFMQADNSTSRKFGGTGLGLSITKSLLDIMGGHIWVESEENHGSTFHVHLALERSENKGVEPIEYTYPDFKNVSILVVDDNRTNLFILRQTLRAWGFKVWEASSGSEALSILEQRRGKFDLIILDHHMPKMDGVAVAHRIRSNPGIRNIKIILLSSWGGLDPQVKKELKLARSITKPAKQSKLFEILMQELRVQKESISQEISSESKPTSVSGRILLVEDSLENQKFAKSILEGVGHEVEIVSSGHLSVKAAERSEYDLILMDVHMPVMNGFLATRKIRAMEQREKRDRVPIIALTAHALDGYREKCLKHDMDDYITKPLQREKLLQVVEEWLTPSPDVTLVDEQRVATVG